MPLRPHRGPRPPRRSRALRPALAGLEGRRLLTVAFEEPVALPAVDGAQGVVLADFNGDGTLDLAVAATKSNWVSVRLGRGDGSFGDESRVVAGSAPVGLAAADLDGDGRLDLVATNAAGNNVSVLLGNGDGTFRPQARYAAGGGPRAVAIADLDGDGAPDLVVANPGNNLSLFRGRGDGTFAPKVDLFLQDQAGAVAVGDFNEDGEPDLIVTGYSSLYLFLNKGAGGFAAPLSFNSSGAGGSSAAAADVNGDGHLDAVRANSANNFVSVLLGDGRGAFDGPYLYGVGTDPTSSSNGEYAFDAAFADLDGDGHPDLVIASNRGLVVRPGDGGGTFSGRLDFARGQAGSQLAVGDLDGDGRPDVVTTDYSTNSVLVFRNLSGSPQASIADARLVEGDDGTSQLVFTVTLDRPAPAALSIGYATSDGTARAGVDYLPAAGTLTFAPGQVTATIPVPILGDTLVEGDETFALDLRPASGLLRADGHAVGTIVDDDATHALQVGDAAVTEGDSGTTDAVFPVQLSTPLGRDLAIRYSLEGLTATRGVDFLGSAGAVTIPAGATTAAIVVPVVGDRTFEGDQAFRVRVTTDDPAVILPGSPAVGTIRDDDPRPALRLADATAAEGDSGTSVVGLVASLSAPSDWPISVSYGWLGGSATPGDDFNGPAGVLTFAPGQTALALPVLVRGDRRVEGPETVGLFLADPVGATIDRGTATLTIVDDDRPSTINLAPTVFSVSEDAVFAVIWVARSEPATEGETVAYATADGSAVAGRDYAATAGVLSFAPGESVRPILVPIANDATYRGDRTFRLDLGFPGGGASLGASRSAYVTIREDDPIPPPPPPPTPTVRAVTPVIRHGGLLAVVVSFSGPVDAARAADRANYRIVAAGRDRRFGTRDDVVVRLRSAAYDPATATATLLPAGRPSARVARRLSVLASRPGGLVDPLGRSIDGNGDGQPGGDFTAAL